MKKELLSVNNNMIGIKGYNFQLTTEVKNISFGYEALCLLT